MGAKDIEAKDYLSNPAIFDYAFNFYIYKGEQRIAISDLRDIDTGEIVVPYGLGAKEPMQKSRDILKLWAAKQDGKIIYIVLGVEQQSQVHYAMPVRNMLYDAMQYAHQVKRAQQSYREQAGEIAMNSAEFLSGFRKEDRLMPVITLVVLFDTAEWDGPLSIHDMLSTDDPEILRLVPNYTIHLLAPNQLDEPEFDKFHTGLGTAMHCIKHLNDGNADWLKTERFKRVDYDTMQIINTITGANFSIDEKERTTNMETMWEKFVHRIEAKMKADMEAKMKADMEAKMKADMEAKMKAKNETLAIDMIRDSMDLALVRKYTRLSPERISELARSISATK